MSTDTIESGRGSYASGTWYNGSGTFTLPNSPITGTWWGSGSWSNGAWSMSNGEFSLANANWEGGGLYRITGQSMQYPWSGSGGAWSGTGTVGPPAQGSGTFGGVFNGFSIAGSWNASIGTS